MGIEAVFEGEQARRWLARLAKKVDEVEGAADEFAGLLSAVVFQDVQGHFNQQRGSKGPWKAWSDTYQAHQIARGKGGNRLLIDDGRLRGSFLPSNYRTAPGGIQWFNPAKTKGGFPYAAAHDEGGKVLPKRDFMWLSTEARAKIEDITVRFILEE